MMKEDRVRLARVRAPQENDVGLLDLLIGAGSTAGTEDRRQTGDAGSVSSSVAAVDVVGAQRHARQFLRGIVQLVGGLGAAEQAERRSARSIDGTAKPGRRALQRFVPGGGPERLATP